MKKQGFTSVFIMMIFASMMLLLASFISVSLDRAADSIASTVTSNAGSSVLTECNKKLHDEYGVLAFKNDCSRLSNIADYYITESIDGINRFVHLKLDYVFVYTADSSTYYLNDFRAQIAELGKKNLVFQNTEKTGLSSFSGVNLPSKSFNYRISINPSSVLSLLNSSYRPGQGLFVTQYAMANFTITELEYLLFGNELATQNKESCRSTIFAIRCLINCVEEIEEPELWLEAITRAGEEADRIMENESELRNYIRAMIFFISSSRVLTLRIMDVMQLTISDSFNFKDYAYKFTITAAYRRGNKTGVYTQTHSWT